MVADGLAEVEIRVVTVGEGRPGPATTAAWTIQVGAFRDRDHALNLSLRLGDHYPDVKILFQDGWHRVRVGRFPQREDANQRLRELRRLGYGGHLVGLAKN